MDDRIGWDTVRMAARMVAVTGWTLFGVGTAAGQLGPHLDLELFTLGILIVVAAVLLWVAP